MLIGRRVAGLEPAPGKVIAVEVSSETISRAVVIERSEGGRASAPLKAALARAGVRTARTHLVTWESEHIHQTLVLPPMTAAERSQFFGRELAREGGGAKVVASQVLRQVEDGVRKDEVLMVAASREGLDRLLAQFLAAGLMPHLVATAPLALVRAAHALSPNPLDQPTIITHWGLSGLTMAVVADGVLKLARLIPRLAVPGLDPVEWVATEVQRSLRAYAQVSKGGRVEQMLFGNAEAAVEGLFSDPAALEARFGVPVLSLNQVLRPLLPEGAEEAAGSPAGVFLLALGAALLTPREAPNLLPREIAVDQRSRRVMRAAVAAAVLLALALGWSSRSASRQATDLLRDLRRQQAARQVQQARLSEVEQVEAERQRVRRWIQLLSDDPLGSPPFADAVKEVSRLAPDQLQLQRLVIAKDERGYAMKLLGTVKEADLAQAQSAFNRLYFGLRDSPLFAEVTYLPEAAKKKEEGPAVIEGRRLADIQAREVAAREVVSAAEQKLAFELSLRLKEMP